MSQCCEEKVNCPKCGGEFTAKYWKSLNSELNPIERNKLIDGTLFSEKCPHCGNEISLNYSILYNDTKNKAMAWLLTDKKELYSVIGYFKKAKSKEEGELQLPEDYVQRVVSTQNELREKAMIFSCGLDDRIVEIAKFAYAGMAKGKCPNEKIAAVFFARGKDENSHQIEMYTESGKVMTGVFDQKMYHHFKSLFEQNINKIPEPDNYLIDQSWAMNAFTIF